VKHDLHNDNSALYDEGVSASDLFADAAISFIERRSGDGVPWLAYVPFNAPHFPVADKKRNGEPNIDQAPNWAFSPHPRSEAQHIGDYSCFLCNHDTATCN